jgi:hypothetical protein
MGRLRRVDAADWGPDDANSRSHDMIRRDSIDTGAGSPQDESMEAALNKYAGDWVAVEHDAVVEHDRNLGDLVERLNGNRGSAEIFKVEPRPDSACAS